MNIESKRQKHEEMEKKKKKKKSSSVRRTTLESDKRINGAKILVINKFTGRK